MKSIPKDIADRMEKARIPMEDRRNHLKWLRFYLDFCEKYDHPPEDPESTSAFMQKLKDKRQSPARRRQAAKSVRVYRDILQRKNSDHDLVSDRSSNLYVAYINDDLDVMVRKRTSGGDFNENFNLSEGGNIFVDPMFTDPGTMDFHLDECSYCIDAGHPDSDYSNEPEPNGGRINMGIYGNTSEAASWNEDCPTRIPTATPTPTPTFIPTFTPTPYLSPTPTPYICDTTGVTVELPKSFFHAGDTFYCTTHVCNRTGIDLIGYPLFVILDVHGEYFFAPSFSSGIDSYLEEYPRFENGETVVTVLPPFQWPANTGSMEGIAFIGALTDPGITEIIGEWDQKTFGWDDSLTGGFIISPVTPSENLQKE